jgi:hypothetical protein
VTEWELMRPNGIRQRIRVTDVEPFQTRCLANVGLTTDFQGDVVVPPRTYPVPSAGLTSTRLGFLEVVEEVPNGAAEFRVVSALLPEVFAGLEKPAWSIVPKTWRPALSGSLLAPLLRALHRSSIGDSRERLSFFATRTVPTFTSPGSGIFEPIAVVNAREAGTNALGVVDVATGTAVREATPAASLVDVVPVPLLGLSGPKA